MSRAAPPRGSDRQLAPISLAQPAVRWGLRFHQIPPDAALAEVAMPRPRSGPDDPSRVTLATGQSPTPTSASARSSARNAARGGIRAIPPRQSAESNRVLYVAPWRIDVVRREGVPIVVADAALARAVAAALEAAGAPAPGSVTVVLTDDVELADLNRTHMGIDGPTDVLSFPMLPPESFPTRGKGGAPGARSRTHIGDIAISVERAIEQAEHGRGGQTGDVRWSPADELRLLVTHGTLHLCGRDHAEPEDEVEMRALERSLLRGTAPSPRRPR